MGPRHQADGPCKGGAGRQVPTVRLPDSTASSTVALLRCGHSGLLVRCFSGHLVLLPFLLGSVQAAACTAFRGPDPAWGARPLSLSVCPSVLTRPIPAGLAPC